MKPFLSGRPQISSNAPLKSIAGLSPAEAVSRAKSAKHDHGGAVPSVETVKQGDKIVRLIVTCSCGERIEIDCVYPTGG